MELDARILGLLEKSFSFFSLLEKKKKHEKSFFLGPYTVLRRLPYAVLNRTQCSVVWSNGTVLDRTRVLGRKKSFFFLLFLLFWKLFSSSPIFVHTRRRFEDQREALET